MALMSQRQYAAHRGVARSAVQRAINEGRISTTPDGRIDADRADAEWERNTIAPEGDGGRLLKARTVYMVSKARLADMQLKRLSGELLPVAEVRIAAFNTARQIRDACQNIPARCCGAITSEIRRAIEAAGTTATLNLAEVENILSGEIRAVLAGLADSLEKEHTADEDESSKTG